jgi:hypothetical protein
MKLSKIIGILLGIIAIVAFYFIYLFIPNRIVVAGNDYIPKFTDSNKKDFLEIQYWDKWMPYKKIEGHSFVFENGKLEVGDAFISSAKCIYSIDEVYAPVIFTSVEADSNRNMIRYECNLYNRYVSPITRVKNYLIAKKIQQQLIPIMAAAKTYYSKPATQDTTAIKK